MASLSPGARAASLALALAATTLAADGFLPGSRVQLSAHNAYPENGHFADRITRALSTGFPVSIEQDLIWKMDPKTGAGHSVVSHGKPFDGSEPSLKDYFFEHVRPYVEKALRENRRELWPLITLHLDLKSDEPEHHVAILKTLGEYEGWLSTAPQASRKGAVEAIQYGPILVLTGEADSQERDFSSELRPAERLRLFGSVRMTEAGVTASPKALVSAGPTNYRRWWNLPWRYVEPGGQPKAGEWNAAKAKRLEALVEHAHRLGYWIRFYTLNGLFPAENAAKGLNTGYNFGDHEKAQLRWKAAIRAGVDYVATDQYEEFAGVLRAERKPQ